MYMLSLFYFRNHTSILHCKHVLQMKLEIYVLCNDGSSILYNYHIIINYVYIISVDVIYIHIMYVSDLWLPFGIILLSPYLIKYIALKKFCRLNVYIFIVYTSYISSSLYCIYYSNLDSIYNLYLLLLIVFVYYHISMCSNLEQKIYVSCYDGCIL